MSTISKKTASPKVQILDGRHVVEMIYLGNGGSRTSDCISRIPSSAFQGKDQNNVAAMKSIKLGDQNGGSLSKWTEQYNSRLGKATAWMKLNGGTSAPRPILISGQLLASRNKFDADGVYVPGSPFQSNDTGEGSKTVISGIGTTPLTIFSGLQTEPPVLPDSCAALFPSYARQIYLDAKGMMVLFVTIRKSGDARHRPHIIYSSDGLKTANYFDPENVYGDMCISADMAVDKDGNYHFVWARMFAANPAYCAIAYRKYSPTLTTLSAVTQISTSDGNYCYDPCIRIKADGTTAAIAWAAGGGGGAAYEMYYREITAAGVLSARQQITSGASAGSTDVRSPSLSFDSSGYRHFAYVTCNNFVSMPFNLNVWYIRETGAGLQARQQINGENNLDGYDVSNVLVDEANTIWIAYTTGCTSGAKSFLYIKNIKAGVVGARTLLENGGVGTLGAISPQIQQLESKNI